MAKTLADKLAELPPARSTRKGPPPACEVYGDGDPDLSAVIEQRKTDHGESWADIQRLIDGLLGIETPIRPDRFRYHFTKKCIHW